MPSERSGKNPWPENERLQGFRIFKKIEIFAKMLKKHWFLADIGFVDMLWSSAREPLIAIVISDELCHHILDCYYTS